MRGASWRLLAGLALIVAATLPVAESAGQPGPRRIGVLTPAAAQWEAAAFRQGLRDLGHVEGRNLTIDVRSADGRLERLPTLAVELVRSVVRWRADAILRLAGQAATLPPALLLRADKIIQ